MNETDRLFAFLDGLAGQCVMGHQFIRLGLEYSDWAIAKGVLQETDIPDRQSCPSCDGAGKWPVYGQSDAWRVGCPVCPEHLFRRFEVSAFTPDLRVLESLCRSALGIERPTRERFADGAIINLGFVEEAESSRSWTALLGWGLRREKERSAAMDALNRQVPRGPGLLISSEPLSLALPLPRQYRLARPSDVFQICDGEMGVHKAGVAQCFGWPGGQPKRPGGRPGRKADVEGAAEHFQARGKWPADRSAQVKLLLKHWPEGCGTGPGRSTLYKCLDELFPTADLSENLPSPD